MKLMMITMIMSMIMIMMIMMMTITTMTMTMMMIMAGFRRLSLRRLAAILAGPHAAAAWTLWPQLRFESSFLCMLQGTT